MMNGRRIHSSPFAITATLILLFVVAALPASGQTYQTWRSENEQNSWQDSNAWWNFPNNSPIVFGQQEWDNNVELTQTNDNGGSTLSTWRWLFKAGASSAHTFTGNEVRFFDFGGDDPRITNESSATHNINLPVSGDGDSGDPLDIYFNFTGGLSFGSTVNNLGSNINILGSAAGAKNLTFGGVVSGAGGMYVNNANVTVLFDATNTYSGQLTINAGTVQLVGTGDTFGAATQDIRIGTGATLDLNDVDVTVGSVAEEGTSDAGTIDLGSATLTVSSSTGGPYFQGSIIGTGSLIKDGTAQLNLFGTQSYTGTTTVSGGKLSTSVSMASSAITVESGATFDVTGEVRVNNLTVQAGGVLVVNAGATLILKSDGHLNVGGTLTNNGTISFERELTGAAGWRMLSSPAQNTTYSSLLGPIWTQGATAGADVTGGSSNVFTWNNSSTGTANSNWSGVTDLTTEVSPGTGFLVYVFDDDNSTAAGGTGFPKTLSVSGTEHADAISPSINSNASGWTLVGNPYASTINFSAVSKTNLTGIAYVWDSNAGTWRSYAQQVGLGEITDGLIKPFQGFFVQNLASGSPSLTFNNDDKTTGGTFYGKVQSQSTHKIRLELSHEGHHNAAWLSLRDQGSVTEQVPGDALELQPLSANFVQLGVGKGDGIFDIAVLPSGTNNYEVPLDVSSTFAGLHSLRATSIYLPDDLDLWLVDTQTGDEAPIRDTSFVYNFSVSASKGLVPPLPDNLVPRPIQAKGGNGDRFVLSFRSKAGSVDRDGTQQPMATTLLGNYPNPFAGQTTIQFTLREPATISLTVFDILGREVDAPIRSEYLSAGMHEAVLDASNLPAGTYLIRLQSNAQYAEHLRVVVQH